MIMGVYVTSLRVRGQESEKAEGLWPEVELVVTLLS